MGVSQLWAVLGGAVRAFDGLTPANMMQLARTLDGKSIAIDTSIWLMEAQTQVNGVRGSPNAAARPQHEVEACCVPTCRAR